MVRRTLKPENYAYNHDDLDSSVAHTVCVSV